MSLHNVYKDAESFLPNVSVILFCYFFVCSVLVLCGLEISAKSTTVQSVISSCCVLEQRRSAVCFPHFT